MEIEPHGSWVGLSIPWALLSSVGPKIEAAITGLSLTLFDAQSNSVMTGSPWGQIASDGVSLTERVKDALTEVQVDDDPVTAFTKALTDRGLAWESPIPVDSLPVTVEAAAQTDEALSILRQSIRSSDPLERRLAADQLGGWLPTPRVLEILEGALLDPDLPTRAYAARALGVLGGLPSLSPILAILEEAVQRHDEWAEDAVIAAAHGAASLWTAASPEERGLIRDAVLKGLAAVPEGYQRQRSSLRRLIQA